ncbi:MAG: response regulator [SAR202 cluster bacterium]|nr:response regulator [SAR202 cluster bacterium]
MTTPASQIRLPNLGVHTTYPIEWVLVGGRFAGAAGLVAASTIGFQGALDGRVLLTLAAIAALYNSAVIDLLIRRRLMPAFAVGVALDNAMCLAAAYMAGAQGSEQDLYLGLFLLLSMMGIRLGFRLGLVLTALWLAAMAYFTLAYYPQGSYVVEQLPLRLVFLGAASVVTIRISSWLRQDIERAEEVIKRYRPLYEDLSDAIIVTDSRGYFVDINRSARRLLDIPGAFEGRRFEQHVANNDLPDFHHAFERVLADTPMLTDVDLLTATGKTLPVEVTGSLVRSGGSALCCFVARDISARKKKLDEETLHERMRALGQISSGLAHDLNNALTPILGFSEMLLSSPRTLDDKQQAMRDIGMIRKAAEEAMSVVRRVRDFYRPRAASEELKDVDLADVVNETVALTQPKWKDEALARNVTITVRTALGDAPKVNGDKYALVNALANLVINSVEEMPEGGVITISLQGVSGKAVLSVADTGVGMTDEVRERAMEPFMTTKFGHGTGLGLAMVYGAVLRHGGQVSIASRVGQGTTVTIEIPAAPGTSHAVEHGQAAKGRALRVLIVDDEAVVRSVLCRMLEMDGHKVEAAESGAEALDLLEKGKFDLMITDRAMPRMNGDSLAIKVKELRPAMPVLMLTGFGEIMQGDGERPAAIDMVLAKPITVETLRAALAKVV